MWSFSDLIREATTSIVTMVGVHVKDLCLLSQPQCNFQDLKTLFMLFQGCGSVHQKIAPSDFSIYGLRILAYPGPPLIPTEAVIFQCQQESHLEEYTYGRAERHPSFAEIVVVFQFKFMEEPDRRDIPDTGSDFIMGAIIFLRCSLHHFSIIWRSFCIFWSTTYST